VPRGSLSSRRARDTAQPIRVAVSRRLCPGSRGLDRAAQQDISVDYELSRLSVALFSRISGGHPFGRPAQSNGLVRRKEE
jgi:hypothetical protein